MPLDILSVIAPVVIIFSEIIENYPWKLILLSISCNTTVTSTAISMQFNKNFLFFLLRSREKELRTAPGLLFRDRL